MMAVLVLSEDQQCGKKCIGALAALAGSAGSEVSVIGPSEAGLSRAKDRFRYVLYVKAAEETAVTEVKHQMEMFSADAEWEKSCSIQYDRNPMSVY